LGAVAAWPTIGRQVVEANVHRQSDTFGKKRASCVRMLGRADNIPGAASGRAVAMKRWFR
jgi:hypothetical protein